MALLQSFNVVLEELSVNSHLLPRHIYVQVSGFISIYQLPAKLTCVCLWTAGRKQGCLEKTNTNIQALMRLNVVFPAEKHLSCDLNYSVRHQPLVSMPIRKTRNRIFPVDTEAMNLKALVNIFKHQRKSLGVRRMKFGICI